MNKEKYKEIYRIPSARWRERDYGANAACFVTVCTVHREHFCGEIGVPAVVETQNFASLRGNAMYRRINRIDRINVIDRIDRRDAMHRVSTNTPVETQNFASLQGNAMHRQIDRRDAMHRVSTQRHALPNTQQSKLIK